MARSRWKQAQSYEKNFWKSTAEKLGEDKSSKLSWYRWRAKNLKNNLEKAFSGDAPDLKGANVIEVGSGPVGLVSALEAAEKIAIDPLCDFFSSQPSLIECRGEDVKYLQGKGEELPFEDGHFDLVVIENVIDHTESAHEVMDELNRVLKDDGILYLTVNLHPPWGYVLHEIVSKLRIDKGHPYTFTISKIRKFLASHGFDVCYDEWQDYKECRDQDWKSNSRKDRLKALSGLSEFLYTSVSQKK